MFFKFECLQCGDCCRNLFNKDETAGLLLLPNEIKFFPENRILPFFGKGKNPDHQGFYVVAFQYSEKICVNLQKSQCTIYNDRPLACRAYPFRTRLISGQNVLLETQPECLAIIKGKKNGIYFDGVLMDNTPEVASSNEMARLMIKFHNRKGRKDTPWRYNLKTKKWELFSK